ncbi:MAG: tetratricopeptide repeat protein [Desulfobacterales bacterium]
MEIRFIRIVSLALPAVMLVACPKPMLKEAPSRAQQSITGEEAGKESPRSVASLQLTDQGSRLLEAHQPDKAIRILEQGVSLNPLNGQNYYYLAEAWLMKGDIDQAKEFNHLAGIHLKDDREWMLRVGQQTDRIAELEK